MSYRPPSVTETNESNWNDCTFCAGLMGVGKWSDGLLLRFSDGKPPTQARLKYLREEIRKKSGLPPDHHGATLDDLAKGINGVWPGLKLNYAGVSSSQGPRLTWDDFVRGLKMGWGFVIQGDEMDLPARLRNWTRNDKFKHALYVEGYKSKGWLLDPLAPAGDPGRPIELSELKKFCWRRSDGAMQVAVFMPGEVVKRSSPYISGEYRSMIISGGASRTSNKLASVRKGTKVYQWPLGPVLTTMGSDADADYMGKSPWAGSGWLAIEVSTTHATGTKDNVICWVKSSDAVVSDRPPVVPPPSPDEELKAAQATIEAQAATIATLQTQLSAAKVDAGAISSGLTQADELLHTSLAKANGIAGTPVAPAKVK